MTVQTGSIKGGAERDDMNIGTQSTPVDLMHRVLIAEDSPVIRRLIGICLRGMDVTIVEEETGPAALEHATTNPPDAMILDVGLPDMEGWEVLRALRTHPRTAQLPVLLLTGHAGESVRRKADAIGASAFMTKPFQPKELRQKLDTLLGSATVGAISEAQ